MSLLLARIAAPCAVIWPCAVVSAACIAAASDCMEAMVDCAFAMSIRAWAVSASSWASSASLSEGLHRSEELTSELPSLMHSSSSVFGVNNKQKNTDTKRDKYD